MIPGLINSESSRTLCVDVDNVPAHKVRHDSLFIKSEKQISFFSYSILSRVLPVFDEISHKHRHPDEKIVNNL